MSESRTILSISVTVATAGGRMCYRRLSRSISQKGVCQPDTSDSALQLETHERGLGSENM